MSSSRARGGFAVVVVLLLVLHVVDPFGPDPAWWTGAMPWDLAYHLGWMVVAAAAVVWMTYRVWPDDDPPEAER